MISFLIWLFNYIPAFVVYGIFFISIIFLIIYRVLPVDPITKNYIKIGSIGFFILSLYASGMIAVITDYKEQMREFELQLAIAEEKSSSVNKEIKYIYKDRKIIIDKNVNKTNTMIRKNEKVLNNCVLTKEMIEIHNGSIR